MGKIAIVTDSNSGITQKEGKELGISVIPMPFYINEELYFEDITLTQDEFYQKLNEDEDIKTSQPAPGDVLDLWEKLLEDHDEIVHIAMSSGLSSSCATAAMLADDYDGKVQVVDNQRISVTQRQSVLDAAKLAEEGKSAKEIKDILEADKLDSGIYIMVDTLKYLKKGGRVTAGRSSHRYSAWNQTSFTDPWREAGCICEDKRCQTGKEKDDRSSKKRVRRAFPRWRFW